MEEATADNQPVKPDSFNYFNYFTEIEEEFVRRRGKPMFISPLDWALIESWKNAQIPLHIVIRAINESFDAYEAKGRKYRKVNSIFYCEQMVESLFADYRLTQVGAVQPPEIKLKQADSQNPSAFSKSTIVEFLLRSQRELAIAEKQAQESQRKNTIEAIRRSRSRLNELIHELDNAHSFNEEAIEHDLDAIDRLLLKSISDDLSVEESQRLRQDAENQLAIYKKKMDKKIFQRTVDNFIARRMREMNLIPRLSLFYI
ncbi:MAG: hypothetical protein AB1757_15285 [Acidobacteriota bacterium]